MSESTWDVDVIVMPKAGVNDPEGEAIRGGLKMLGYGSVSRVRAGRMIKLQLEATSADAASAMASEMADKLLANPVIEVFEVAVVGLAKETAQR